MKKKIPLKRFQSQDSLDSNINELQQLPNFGKSKNFVQPQMQEQQTKYHEIGQNYSHIDEMKQTVQEWDR